jgi:hypothetical protein
LSRERRSGSSSTLRIPAPHAGAVIPAIDDSGVMLRWEGKSASCEVCAA